MSLRATAAGPPMAWRWILPVVAGKVALNLSVLERYGWHRDELYYFDAGRHPAAGYVDFPAVTPLLAGLSRLLFGDSLFGLRLIAVLAGAATIVLACVICRRLGGGTAAQALTAVALAVAPFLLGANALFQTVTFDQLAWALAILATLEVVRRPDTVRWIALGLAVGLALNVKYTAAVLVAGLVVGFAAVSDAGPLRDRRALLAAGIAAAAMIPNLVWQATHDWASLDFVVNPPPSATDETRPEFLLHLVLLAAPVGLALAVAGFVRLARTRSGRPLAIAAGFALLAFLATGGKSYYAAPILVLLIPAGAVALERFAADRRWAVPAAAGVALIALVPMLPLVIPVRSAREMASSDLWDERTDYADEVGWPELARTVGLAHRTLPPGAAVVAENYGQAGAVNLHGRDLGLPRAVSRHLSHRHWSPGAAGSAHAAVLVGYPPATVARMCASRPRTWRIRNDLGIDNPEWGRPVVACRLRAPLRALWRHA